MKNIMASHPGKKWKSLSYTCLIGSLALFVSACQPAKISDSGQKEDLGNISTKTTGAQDLEKLLPPKGTPSYEDLANTPTVDPLMRLIEPQPPVIGARPLKVASAETVKVAILLPLSGQNEAIGNDLLRAANMALFDLQNGQLQLLPFDTKGTVRGAESAAAEALIAGSQLILGPLFSSSVPPVRALAQGRGVNVITFSTDTTVAGNGVYVMGLTVGQQIRRVMEFAYRQGLLNFAVLAPDSRYGDAVINDVTAETETLGLSLDRTVRYPVNVEPGSQELHDIAKILGDYQMRQKQLAEEIKLYEKNTDDESKEYVKKLQKLDTFGPVSFDALIIPEGGARLKELASLLSYYDIDPEVVQFIGTGLWADPSLSAEPALVGGWFSAPAPEKAAAFRDRFEKTYSYLPSRIASLAYDATALAGLLAQDPPETRFDRAAIENANGFTGYDGIFRFPANEVAERGLAVLEVGPKKLLVLEPAPQSFTPLVN
ncbi:MAG: penicillin-binding protein activator [Sneathiella sp.]|nr:penicillin-binding protein activator [Sneathiella sp.]